MQKEVKIRIVGTGVFTTLDKKPYKAVMNADEKAALKEMVEKYNKKPSDYWMKRIVKMFTIKEKVNPKKVEKKKEENKKKLQDEFIKTKKKEVKSQKIIGDKIEKAIKTTETLGTVADIVQGVSEHVKKQTEEIKEEVKKHEVQPRVSPYRKPGEY